jgi:hypothetical protein
MNRAICVSTAFLLGSAVMAAQTTTTPKKDSPVQATVIQVAPPVSSCPVSLQAQQTPGGDRVLVDGLPPTGIAQKLHLIVNASDSKRIVAANVTVHGYTNKSRAMPAMANQDTGDGAKTLNVSFPTGPKREIRDICRRLHLEAGHRKGLPVMDRQRNAGERSLAVTASENQSRNCAC